MKFTMVIKHSNKVRLSAVVIAKNEEEKIGDCLESVRWADEVIVIDNNSSDKTAQIAKEKGTTVFNFGKEGYSTLRNFGLEKSHGQWILYVDADERVTFGLSKEIESRITNHESRINAYAIPRRNIILGKEMRHGGWWPDYVKRLFLRSGLEGWKGDLHEEPLFEGELGHLENPLVHIKEDNLSDMVQKTNEWSDIEAKLMFESGHPPMNIARFLGAMIREFWLRMIKHAAFLDGSEGVIFALYQVYSRFISYAKLWEMQIVDERGLKTDLH